MPFGAPEHEKAAMSTVVTGPAGAAPLPGASASCPTCGLPLSGPVAMRLWQVDQHIAALHVERTRLLEQLRHGVFDIDAVRPDVPGLGVGEPDKGE